MNEQLELGVRRQLDNSFANFYLSGDGVRSALVKDLQSELAAMREELLYLWGLAGSGRSHLLQAVCNQAHDSGQRSLYLPLSQLRDEAAPEVLADLDQLDVICLDDIDDVVNTEAWQLALFGLYNRCHQRGIRLVVSARVPPAQLSLSLADLRSRLSAMTVFQLPPYSDADKARILQFRAERLGMVLSDKTARFMLNRSSRELTYLIERLANLDRQTLRFQRRLTIPFIKEIFRW